MFPQYTPEVSLQDERLEFISEKMRAVILKIGVENIEFEAKLGRLSHNLDCSFVDPLAYNLLDHMLNKSGWDILPPAKLTATDSFGQRFVPQSKGLYKFQPGLNS
jgi:hypothetical protein